MPNSATGTAVAVEFGAKQLKANAALYRQHKRLIDAVASKYDGAEDAIAAIQSVVEVLSRQVKDGAGYTPDVALGFGSSNSTQIAERILGVGTSDATTRKQFAELGK